MSKEVEYINIPRRINQSQSLPFLQPNIAHEIFMLQSYCTVIEGEILPLCLPFNSNVFTDEDFLSCFVTDRTCPTNDNPSNDNETVAPSGSAVEEDASLRSSLITSSSGPSTSGYNVTTNSVSPKDICPFPKAGQRKQQKKGKQPLKSAVLTSTPVKDRLEKEAKEREERKKIKAQIVKKKLYKSLGLKKKCETMKRDIKKKKKFMPKRPKQIKDSDSEEEEEDALCLICLKPFSESKPGENWIQCISCKRWAHIACGKDKKVYVCINCSPGRESSDSN